MRAARQVRVEIQLGLIGASLALASCEKEQPVPRPDPVEPKDAGPVACGKGSFRNAAPGFCITPPSPYRALGTKAGGDKRVRKIEVAGMGTFELEWGPVADKERTVNAIVKAYAFLGVKPVTLPSGAISYKGRVAGHQVATTMVVSGDAQIICHAPVLDREDAAAFGACETLVAQPASEDAAQAKLDRDTFIGAKLASRSRDGVKISAASISCESADDCGFAEACQRSVPVNKASIKDVETQLEAGCQKRATALLSVLGARSRVTCDNGLCEEHSAFGSSLGDALAGMSRNGPRVVGQRAVTASVVKATVPRWMSRPLATGGLKRNTGLRLCYAAMMHPTPTDIDVEFTVSAAGKATADLKAVAPELRACAEAALADQDFYNDDRATSLRFQLRLEPATP